MKSYTKLGTLYTSLSQNISAANLSLGQQLINDTHRYLLQRYFDNEKTYTATTIGAQSLTLTGSLASGATSATLTAAWTSATVSQMVNFSNSNTRSVLFTNGSTAISWSTGLTTTATTAISTIGVQAYPIPANISKIINDTITVGQLRFRPAPIMSRAEWDLINTLPYASDIPNYYYIYNGNVEFWPIPSTTGNLISFNHKSRVPDLSFADASDGHIANAGMTVGGLTVTGTGTAWTSTDTFPVANVSFFNLKIAVNPPYGDGIWYPILSFQSDTALTLQTPVQVAPNITSSSTYTIGQFPLLQEDFHDMLVHGALMTYFSSIVPNQQKYEQFKSLYDDRLKLLQAYAGTKAVNVDLGSQEIPRNPNLFRYPTS